MFYPHLQGFWPISGVFLADIIPDSGVKRCGIGGFGLFSGHYISDNFGFECHDREEINISGARIELMDLYKDETLFAVKIGNASSVLCYAVDQSTAALKIYKQRVREGLPVARKFSVWILLDRRTRLELVDGKPNINELEMLAFKNKLDAWKKEVRALGCTPVIMLNYFN